MTDGYTHSAVAAAVDVAQRYGLPADDLEVLHERSNVLVRLGPVVARVPGTTRLVRGTSSAWLARDVALSGFLTERGVRVVSPLSDPPAGPHSSGGLPVTLWHFTPHERDHRYAPREVAESLAEVHRTLDLWPDLFDGHTSELRAEAERMAPTLAGGAVQGVAW